MIYPDIVRQLRREVCDRCSGTGYNDRMVISEVLDIDDEIRDLIQPNARTATIEEAARRKGMVTMDLDGLKKCQDGLTTIDEVRRVVLDV